jgi:DNA-binding NarL/FixJ family response regulator
MRIARKKKFTSKEVKIIRLICEQHTSKEIAKELGLSHRTIESCRETILKKTRSKNIVGAVLFAIRNKIIELS